MKKIIFSGVLLFSLSANAISIDVNKIKQDLKEIKIPNNAKSGFDIEKIIQFNLKEIQSKITEKADVEIAKIQEKINKEIAKGTAIIDDVKQEFEKIKNIKRNIMKYVKLIGLISAILSSSFIGVIFMLWRIKKSISNILALKFNMKRFDEMENQIKALTEEIKNLKT